MVKLEYMTQMSIEELLDMSSGWVLDFSNNSFGRFVKGVIGIDIYNDKGYEDYCSKAMKLRQVFENESNIKVAKLIIALLNYCEDYKLKNNTLTEYDKKKISEIKKDIEALKKEEDENISPVEELDELIQKISTRNAQFAEMAIDEKLKEIGNVIEFLLKRDKKFISLDYDTISSGFISEEDVIKLRKKVQCFRHSSKSSIDERGIYTEKQKQFMVEFGLIICNMIYSELQKNNKILI